MGSPLAPILTNLFLGFHEETWLNNFNKADILIYRRFVDETFCVFNSEQDAMLFFESLTLSIPASNLVSRNRTTVNFLFWIYWLTTLRMTVFFQFFIKKSYIGLLTNFCVLASLECILIMSISSLYIET